MTVGFVQVGTGFWGASWAPLLRGRADVELVALVDIDPAASARVASEIGLGDDRCFSTVGDALAAGLDLDAALVVVQPEHHEAVTVPALRAGLHCLVEKPIAHTVASARAIVDEGRRANRVVTVSQKTPKFNKGTRQKYDSRHRVERDVTSFRVWPRVLTNGQVDPKQPAGQIQPGHHARASTGRVQNLHFSRLRGIKIER